MLISLILLILSILLVVPAASDVGAREPLNIGSRLEPFVDDYMIEKMDGVALVLQHPIVREEVIRFDAPWEGDTSGYVTVLADGAGYRMYYRGSALAKGTTESTCVAVSTDGIKWTKPKLGIFEHDGSSQNNIVWRGPGAHAFTPFKDTNPNAKPGEAYKAVGPGDGGGKSVLFAFVSPDGYYWKLLQEDPIITKGAFDSQNLVFWDSLRSQYVCYLRDFRDDVRDIKRAFSADFRTWTEPEWVVRHGGERAQLYTNAVAPYVRAPQIYLGFPKRFMPERKPDPSHVKTGVSDGVFMTSRDGLDFHIWDEAFYRPGLDPENWTDRNNMAAWGIHELRPRELSIYYSSHYQHPTNRMVRTTIRTDGFVSVHAGAKAGTMLTKPLVFEGAKLAINFSTSAAGGVRVEVQDADGRPVPGFTLEDCPATYGDQIERVVDWTGGSDLSELAGKPVRLEFELADADLYSIRFLP